MKKNTIGTWKPLILVFTAALACPATAETGPAAGDEGRVIVERCADFYAGLESVSAAMEVKMELPEKFTQGMTIPPLKYDVALAKPASAAFEPRGGGMEPRFVQDGKRQYTEMAPFKQYILAESPATLAGLIADDQGEGPPVPGAGLLAGLGLEAGTAGALRDAGPVTLLGEEAVGETPCHHLSITGGAYEGELWVAAGDRPWVLRHRTADPGEAGEPDENGMLMIMPRLDFRFSGWRADPDLAGRFAIEPNEAFTRVDRFVPPADGGGAGPGDEALAHPTLDKPAPEVTLVPLEGEPVALSSLKGKVVVLDFWATWCGPCRVSLPKVAALAEAMAGQNVAFYAVNLMEPKEKAAAYMEKEKLEIDVALDGKGEAAKAFGVRGIPHLVVIDGEGVVRKVHIGFAPGGEERLKAEIETLLE